MIHCDLFHHLLECSALGGAAVKVKQEHCHDDIWPKLIGLKLFLFLRNSFSPLISSSTSLSETWPSLDSDQLQKEADNGLRKHGHCPFRPAEQSAVNNGCWPRGRATSRVQRSTHHAPPKSSVFCSTTLTGTQALAWSSTSCLKTTYGEVSRLKPRLFHFFPFLGFNPQIQPSCLFKLKWFSGAAFCAYKNERGRILSLVIVWLGVCV